MNLNKSPENHSLLSKRRNKLLAKKTKSEKWIELILHFLGEHYMPQKGFLSENTHYIVDFYLPKRKKLCLEIDGGYHTMQAQKEYDARRTFYLEEARGFRVLRLTNEEALEMDGPKLLEFIS